ncbi:MAG: hypothetical protein FJ088_15420, partial [Deltaproteobacteria bacterium]|nr:hypothetical protein [Deltaproteobacteria bacterium]
GSLAAASGETTLSFGELAVIYGKFCERMEKAGVLDQAAEITLAGDAVESGGGRLCDAIVFYGFYDLIGVNQEMTEKLMSRYDSYLFFPFCDDFFLAGARLLLDGFVPEEKIARSPRNPIPGCVEKVISASGTDNEIRAVAKEIIRLHAVEGVSYDDIAIVSRGGDTMNRIFAVLRGEKIPVRGQYHVPGCEMPPLAAFLKLMNLEDSGFPAKHFLDLFASAFFRFQDSAARERTTALLGNYFSNYEITGGVQWKDVAPASDPGIMKRLRIGREDLDMIISGITLIKRIIADIGAIPDAAAPSYYSSAYLDLLRKYFDAGEDLTETGFASQALEQAGERISYLARLDEITPSLRKGDFLGILRRFLSEASFPCGSFRSRGVFAGSAMQARGLT